MKAPAVTVLDFETKAIEGRPNYPPVPVGFSVKTPQDKAPVYYAWGHPTENNCSKELAARALERIFKLPHPILCHHAKFDIDVAQTHMSIGKVDWEKIHDTLYLLFLNDPFSMSFALKPASEKLLGLKPEEQEKVRDWLIHAGIVKKNDGKWGKYISEAPGELVGSYAKGDVKRTLKLFNLLYPKIVSEGMLKAYNRERELMPILLENERQGVRVNLHLLKQDIIIYSQAMETVDNWLRRRLGVKDLNIDADEDVAEALERADIVKDWVLTKTGRKSTAKKNLTPDMFTDQKVAQALGYHNRLQTCLSTFMLPWAETARKTRGIIHTNWNQVRQASGDSSMGTRTGRLSCSPNFQNIPKVFLGRGDGYEHPKFLQSVPELPQIRRYVLPDKGQNFLHRDYNQQELRILAHFEDSTLCEAYKDNAKLDIHNYVGNEIAKVTGKELSRSAIKILNFGIIYGMGMAKLAIGTETSVEEAKKIKDAHRKGVPGVAELERTLKSLATDEAIRTWGARRYYVEPPKLIEGRLRSFEYKRLNYLVQGSAADCTKQAIINYHKAKKDGRFLVTVHDEINISAPKGVWKKEMKILKEAMEGIPFDVPMLSDGKVGNSWGNLQACKE